MKKMILFLVLSNFFISKYVSAQTMIIQTKNGTEQFDLSDIVSITFTLTDSPVDTVPDPPDSVGTTGDFLSWTGINDNKHYLTLVRVDGEDGSVTGIGGSNNFPAMAYDNDGVLYGISDELHIINTTNGSTVQIGKFVYEGEDMLMSGAAFSPTGTLYVKENASPKRIFTVNLENASLTYIGIPPSLIWDIEFSSSGTLYAAFAQLYILDPYNMSAVRTVGWTGYFIEPLTLGEDGVMFSLDHQSTTIFSVDITTGKATPILTPGSNGLKSLVVERIPTMTARSRLSEAIKKYGLAPVPSTTHLLDIEKEILFEKNARVAR
ncbi:hypothetical protein JW935_23900 [candidate division KSB1 bacterium]|nr:hypothetical protein [candidate division KSB1 bacterium]